MMQKIMSFSRALVLQYVKKGVMTLAIASMLPTPIALAEPSVGMLGSLALTNAASTVSVPMIKRPKQEKMVATFTAYTSRANETDSDPFISADGNHVYDGLIACSREYPFGTKVTVNGRTYRCGDRMAQKNDHATNLAMTQPKFDIWMDDLTDAKQWGRRTLEATVVYPN